MCAEHPTVILQGQWAQKPRASTLTQGAIKKKMSESCVHLNFTRAMVCSRSCRAHAAVPPVLLGCCGEGTGAGHSGLSQGTLLSSRVQIGTSFQLPKQTAMLAWAGRPETTVQSIGVMAPPCLNCWNPASTTAPWDPVPFPPQPGETAWTWLF